ncbi:NAD(P)-binding domain-containing protein [Flavobacterium sp. IMCC34518]|uniref:NADPH-dependent F420 reductase n=1 Tax=Flavobacterium sp. IMCC34518 TaxID=3003623 RepID=UPI0022AC2061|nr:NAD(P)-binding domain-containing protein [Flavobacterium sp. IMCC34518]
MKIAIIGTGNVGGALATNWSKKGHTINLGVQDVNNFKGVELMKNQNTTIFSINEAVAKSDVILIATPPTAIFEILEQMGDVSGKTIIDATNSVVKSPEPYKTVYHALADKTNAEIVKCFNTTGFENMLNPIYNGEAIDMFMAGERESAKSVALQLSTDAGFGSCIDFGKSDKVELLEKFALSWINLAIMQGHGRNLAFKVVRR